MLRTIWRTRGTLLVGGRLTEEAVRDGGELRLRAETGTGAVHEVPTRTERGGSTTVFTARLPIGRLGTGCWTLTLIMEGPGEDAPRRTAVVPYFDRLAATRWLRFGCRPYYAKPVALGPARALGLEVAPIKVVTGVRRRLGW
ncbi:hypothetical protein JBE04_42485 [Streptomyces sp. PRKS01-29]|nr:hypothetical protein [Streptomyces sabulosicollis]